MRVALLGEFPPVSPALTWFDTIHAMVKSGGEIVHQEDIYPDRSVECVLLFAENPAIPVPGEKYSVRGIIRLHGYRNLSLDEKLITYADKLAAAIDVVRADLHAPLFGFITIDEAEQMFRGALENGVSQALRTAKREHVHIIDILFKNGNITVVPQQEHPALQEG